MRVIAASVLVSALVFAVPLAQRRPAPAKTLDIYYIDVEGGQATLFVSPSGESLLVDTGFPGDRDLGRIMEAVKAAGLTEIDHLISTHYHIDHIGNVLSLASVIPIKHFYDHGPTVETEREQVPGFQAAYKELYSKATHTVLKPGDKVPIAGLDWQIVTSAGQVLKTNLTGAPGAGKPNPYCADFKPKDVQIDPENDQSVGSVIAYGKFRTIDLGDLIWNSEGEMMCPTNRIGAIDVYLSTCHGQDWSNSKALVYGLQPRVIIMDNGTRKGGQVEALETFESAPGVEGLWQLHWSYNGGLDHNPPGRFIANIDDAATASSVIANPPPPSTSTIGPPPPRRGGPPPGQPAGAGAGRGNAAGHVPAYWIKVSARQDGTFTVTNPRNGFSKTYKPRG